MSKTPHVPTFINAHNFKVQIVGEDKNIITLSPYSQRHVNQVGAVYTVRGTYYSNQVHPYGSLAPLTETAVANKTTAEAASGGKDSGGDSGENGGGAGDGAGSGSGGAGGEGGEGGTDNPGEGQDGSGAGNDGGDEGGGSGSDGKGDEMTLDQVEAELKTVKNKQLQKHVLENYGIEIPSGHKSHKDRLEFVMGELENRAEAGDDS